MMHVSQILNTGGIVLSLVGVLILFQYGMPFRIPTGGVTYIVAERIDEEEKRVDDRHVTIGYAGIILIVIGAIAQIVATWS